MQVRWIVGLIMWMIGCTVVAQTRSAEVQAFLEDARNLTDHTRKLRESVHEHFRSSGELGTTDAEEAFLSDVQRLATGAELCERKVDTSSDIPAIEESILKVFVRMNQVNDSSTTVELSPQCIESIQASKKSTQSMLLKYVARKQIDPNWELQGGRSTEKDPEIIAHVSETAYRFLSTEYALNRMDAKVEGITKVGIYHIAEIKSSKRVYKVLVNNKLRLVILERNYLISNNR